MPQNPPEGMQRVIPYLAYADAPAALDFLVRAFGFRERFKMAMPDGHIGHAELALGDCVLMLASTFEEMGFASPKDLPGQHGQVLCYVDDVDSHHATAVAEGATVTGEPEDQPHGDRTYRALDPEGHRWIFATCTRDLHPVSGDGSDPS